MTVERGTFTKTKSDRDMLEGVPKLSNPVAIVFPRLPIAPVSKINKDIDVFGFHGGDEAIEIFCGEILPGWVVRTTTVDEQSVLGFHVFYSGEVVVNAGLTVLGPMTESLEIVWLEKGYMIAPGRDSDEDAPFAAGFMDEIRVESTGLGSPYGLLQGNIIMADTW